MNKKKEKITIALKKAKTSLDKILLAIENADEKKCFELMQQNLAIIGLLKSANVLMLENHLDLYIESIANKSVVDKRKMQQVRDEVVRIVRAAQNK